MEDKISIFAFKTGRLIEDLIIKETNNLKEENQLLQGKILEFYHRYKNTKCKTYEEYNTLTNLFDDYNQFFNITKTIKGEIF